MTIAKFGGLKRGCPGRRPGPTSNTTPANGAASASGSIGLGAWLFHDRPAVGRDLYIERGVGPRERGRVDAQELAFGPVLADHADARDVLVFG